MIDTASRQGRDALRLNLVKAHAAFTTLKEMSPEVLSTAEDQIKNELRVLERLRVRNDRYRYLKMAGAVVHEARTREMEEWTKRAREMAISKVRQKR